MAGAWAISPAIQCSAVVERLLSPNRGSQNALLPLFVHNEWLKWAPFPLRELKGFVMNVPSRSCCRAVSLIPWWHKKRLSAAAIPVPGLTFISIWPGEYSRIHVSIATPEVSSLSSISYIAALYFSGRAGRKTPFFMFDGCVPSVSSKLNSSSWVKSSWNPHACSLSSCNLATYL